MKKSMFLALFLSTGSVWAATSYKLDDAKILGGYNLHVADKSSDMQEASIVYNHDNQLVVRTSRNDDEYVLTAPDKDGQVYFNDQGEPNCDGDENRCYFDGTVKINLVAGKNADGQKVPQLTISVTVVTSWDNDDTEYPADDQGNQNIPDETTVYTLDWNHEISNAVPFYLNAPVSKELDALTESCKTAMTGLNFDLLTSDICPYSTGFSYRDTVDAALVDLKEDWSSKDPWTEMSKAQLKTEVFDKARALATKYTSAKSKVSAAQVIAQLDLIEAYVDKADKVYAYPYIRDMSLFLFNTKTKTIERFNIPIRSDYPN